MTRTVKKSSNMAIKMIKTIKMKTTLTTAMRKAVVSLRSVRKSELAAESEASAYAYSKLSPAI